MARLKAITGDDEPLLGSAVNTADADAPAAASYDAALSSAPTQAAPRRLTSIGLCFFICFALDVLKPGTNQTFCAALS
jgi:hypothetical protein